MVVAMLDWQQAAVLAVGLVVLGAALSFARRRRLHALGPFAREGAIVAGLYAIWQLAGAQSHSNTSGAFARARWIVHAERDLHLPSETDVQHLLTDNATSAHVIDLYYATMHFSVMGIFLIWLFVRHRDRYRPVRRVLAVLTLLCLLVQLWLPVAPPRLLPQYGFVDTALKYHQSVYGNGFDADQLSAMPSVHVAWAVLVAITVWRVSPSRWRFVGPLHAVVTVLVVVSTANHFWADGIVAVALLGLSVVLVRGGIAVLGAAADRLRPGARPEPPEVAEPVASPV